MARFEIQRLSPELRGLTIVSLLGTEDPKLIPGIGIGGIDPENILELPLHLLPAGGVEAVYQPAAEMSRGKGGIATPGLAIGSERLLKPAALLVGQSQVKVDIRGIRLALQCLAVRADRFRDIPPFKIFYPQVVMGPGAGGTADDRLVKGQLIAPLRVPGGGGAGRPSFFRAADRPGSRVSARR